MGAYGTPQMRRVTHSNYCTTRTTKFRGCDTRSRTVKESAGSHREIEVVHQGVYALSYRRTLEELFARTD